MINLVKLFIIGLVFLSIPASALSDSIEKKYGDWKYKMISDDLHDTQQHIAFTRDSLKDGEVGTFAIKCEKVGGKIYAVYVTGQYLGKDITRKTTYRVDKQEPVSQEWELHGQFASTLDLPFEEVKSMIDALITGKKLIIQVYDFEFDSVRNTFSLDGAAEAIGYVLKGCEG